MEKVDHEQTSSKQYLNTNKNDTDIRGMDTEQSKKVPPEVIF
jgi:hypothetical protein